MERVSTDYSNKMNTTVNTVTGPIDINELGFISPHEHVLYAARDNCEEAVLEELKDYRHFGGNTIMEMSTPEICPADRKELSLKSGVNIVYGAGFYKEPRLPQFIKEKTVDELKEMIKKELLEGRGEEHIKAGFIGEVGSSNYQVYETEEKVLRAAGRASAETGFGIYRQRNDVSGTAGFF